MPHAYYLKLGSGKSQLTGTSCDAHHVGWIKLMAFHWEETKSLEASGGGGPGKVAFRELNVSKVPDRITSQLMLATHDGMGFDSAVLEIADARTGRPTLRVDMSDVMIATHAVVQGQTETFRLSFRTVEFNHNPTTEDGVDEILQSVFKSIGLGRTVSCGAHP
jgi:type VI protein secretion system component Hcp